MSRSVNSRFTLFLNYGFPRVGAVSREVSSIVLSFALVTFSVGYTGVSNASQANDERLPGFWENQHGCYVHIGIDGDGTIFGAAWGGNGESMELKITIGKDRRFPWKRKTKKSGFADPMEFMDPGRKGRFIVNLHNKDILHTNYGLCYFPKSEQFGDFVRLPADAQPKVAVPKWYMARFGAAQDIAGQVKVVQSADKEKNEKASQGSGGGNVSGSTSSSQQTGGGLGGLLTGLAGGATTSEEDDVTGLFGAAGKLKSNSSGSNSDRTTDHGSGSQKTQASSNAAGGLGNLLGALSGNTQKKSDDAAAGLGNLLGALSGDTQKNSDDAAAGLGNLLGALSGDTQKNSGNAAGGLGGLITGLTGGSQGGSTTGQQGGFGNIFQKAQELKDRITMGPVDRHYLGRMVSAKVLGKYPKVLRADHPRLQYVRSILVTLARYSRVPYVYQEYVPIVIHDQAINAFAAPGGFVFITTGMLDFVINEDELALILAHELSHVELNHGVSAVTNAEGAKLMSQFVGDITGGAGMSQLVDGLLDFGEKGYDVSVEAEADARGLFIAQQAGYDPTVFPPLMERLKKVVGHYGGEGYPKERADLVRRQLVNNRYLGSRGSLEVRSDRFRMVMNRN